MEYTPVAMPPQEPSTLYVCGTCSALVRDPDQHTASQHTAAPAKVSGERTAPTVAPREYTP